MFQIISKVSDASSDRCCWSIFKMRPFSEAGKVKSSTSLSQKCKSIANFDVVDRCSKMRPFSEAGKVKSSTSLSQKCKIIANCAYSFGLSFGLSLTAILDFPRSSDSRWIIVRRSWLTRSQSYAAVLPVGTITSSVGFETYIGFDGRNAWFLKAKTWHSLFLWKGCVVQPSILALVENRGE